MYRYTPLAVVGEGTYGVVAKCRDEDTGRLVAVKRLNNWLTNDCDRHCEIIVREICLLRVLVHDHVVRMIRAFRHCDMVYMVFPLMQYNLYRYLELQGGQLVMDDAKRCVYQVLKGLNYVHSQNVVHRDIKPENILVTSEGIVTICDFGVSRMFCSVRSLDLSPGVGTMWYQAPEILLGLANYDTTADVWSIGVLFTELMNRTPVVAESTTDEQVQEIIRLFGSGVEEVDEFLRKRGVKLAPIAVPQQVKKTTTEVRKSYAVADTASSLRRIYPEWPTQLLETVAYCMQLNPAKRKSTAQLLDMELFTVGSFGSRFDRELRLKLRRNDDPVAVVMSGRRQRRRRRSPSTIDTSSRSEQTRNSDEPCVLKKQRTI